MFTIQRKILKAKTDKLAKAFFFFYIEAVLCLFLFSHVTHDNMAVANNLKGRIFCPDIYLHEAKKNTLKTLLTSQFPWGSTQRSLVKWKYKNIG